MRYSLYALVLVSILGCGASPPGMKSTPIPVKGKVVLAGQPVRNVAISLQPLDAGHMKSLHVQADGTFQGDMIPGKYAYSIVQVANTQGKSQGKIPPQYLEPDLERTVQIDAGL